MTGSFSWPTPPHFSAPPGAAVSWPEECLLAFNDGRTLSGKLLRFLPYEGRVILQPRSSDANGQANGHVEVGFSSIKHLVLTRPISLTKHESPAGILAAEISRTPETQEFSVETSDGDRLTGETMGYVTEKFGIFLFLVTKSRHLQRYFIPVQSFKDYHIGHRIGEMLVANEVVAKDDVEAGLLEQKQLRSRRIGEYLIANQVLTPEQLAAAVKRQKSLPHLKFGEVLLQEKLIGRKQLDEALANQNKDRTVPLGEILVKAGLIDQETVKLMLAKQLGIPFVNLSDFQVDPNVIKLIPESIARKLSVMPLCRTESTLIVAMENPTNWEPLDILRFHSGLQIEPVLALTKEILVAIDTYYGSALLDTNVSELASELERQHDAEELPDEQVSDADNALVRLVNKIIIDAYRQGASDIHIETYPGKKNSRIRFREDGALTHYLDIPANFRKALVSRIKIMGQLDISERRKPQDGKIDFRKFGPANVELRVATVPTANGLEDVVMRVLTGAKPLPIDELGLENDSLEHLKNIATKHHGLFLICGPTGSGKSTTLHSVLSYINTPERKIWTAEDPIEITQDGLRQVQVNPKIGWTFAAALRSFLRADPDVIMVGEMRDQETAGIAIKAALTGHLVFSTLHTNGAPESIVRLLDMGMDPFNFADALAGVLSQRLAKRLCPKCKRPRTAKAEEIRDMLKEYCLGTALKAQAVMERWRTRYADSSGKFTLFAASGCRDCENTGYSGRIALHELLVTTPAISKLIHSRATAEQVATLAISEGMRTLKQDGIEKVLQGRTNAPQVRAVSS